MTALNVVLFGAGLIGQRHAQLVQAHDGMKLTAIIDPAEQASALADEAGAAHFHGPDAFLSDMPPCDCAIVATPNATHATIALACMDRGIPCLIEKPLADTPEDARTIAQVSEGSGVPVLVGHHRRHHHAAQAMKAAIDDGALGKIVAAQVTWMLRKPDAYFEAGAWRLGASGGPVWINLIHEIDMLLFLLGPVDSVTAITANSARGAGVEDCAAVALAFESGALATALVSDATPSPWHFEGASGENPNIAHTGQDGLRLFGTKASASFPSLKAWGHSAPDGGWGDALEEGLIAPPQPSDGEVALTAQLDHFAAIVRKGAQPIVTAREGAQSVAICDAVLQSARTGKRIFLGEPA